MEYEEVLAALKSEIGRYYDGELSEDLSVDDLQLVGDDLTAIALALERELRLKLDRKMYRQIRTIADWARLLHQATG